LTISLVRGSMRGQVNADRIQYAISVVEERAVIVV